MYLAFLIHIPILIFIVVVLKRKIRPDPLSKFYWWGITWKILCGILIGLLYTYYYHSGDTFKFYKNSLPLTDILFNNPSEYFRIFFFNDFSIESQKIIKANDQPRVVTYLKILSILNIFTLSNYWINSLYLSLYSFIGTWLLANSLVKIYNLSKPATAIAFFFFPSFVFWTSGVLKESFVIGSLFLIVAYILEFIHKKRRFNIVQIILLILLTYFCWHIKFYYVLIALPTVIAYCIIVLMARKISVLQKPIAAITAFIFLFGSIAITGIFLHPSFSIQMLCDLMYANYSIILKYSISHDKFAYAFDNFSPDIWTIVINTPKALCIGLFRPFIWESPFNLTYFMGAENLLIMILFLGKLFHVVKKPSAIKQETIALLVYVFMTATLMALTTPNWGTLSRYKCAFMPFWILFLLINNPIFIFFVEKTKNLFLKRNLIG